MPFLIDGILVAVAVVFALIGLRKGFVKSLLGLVAAVIALIAAFFAARYLAQWLYDLSVRSVVLSFVETKLQEMHIDSAASAVASMPKSLLSLLGGNESTMLSSLENASGKLAETIVNVCQPLILNVLMIILVILLFILFLIVLRLLIRLLNLGTKLPIVKQVNGLLGFFFGLGKGIIVIWLLCLLAQITLPLLTGTSVGSWIGQAVNRSFLYGALTGFNPLSGLLY